MSLRGKEMRTEEAPAMAAGDRLTALETLARPVAASREPAALPAWQADHRRSLAVSERRILLVLMDVLVLLLIGYGLSWDKIGPGAFPGLAIVFSIPWLVFGQISGIYDLATAARPQKSIQALTATSIAFDLTLLLIFFLHGSPFFISRPKLIIFAIAGPMAIGLWRFTYIRMFGAVHFQRRVLVIGAGAAGATLLRAVRSRQGHGINVVGILDDDPNKHGAEVEGSRVLGSSEAMWPLISELQVEEVVLALNQPSSEALYQGLGTCYEHSIAVSMMPRLYEEVTGQVPVEFMGPHWFGSVQLGRSGGGMAFAVKRIIDVVAASLALIILLPVIALIAVLVRLSSRGPILHRQHRMGLHGHPFEIVKFRTMRADAEAPGKPVWATLDDPRATSIGRWLRRTHLDELPQLFQVVRGDMSLVGPRPERPEFVAELEHNIPLYRARYSMRPGIAGWAQLHYPYGASVEDALAKLRYDLYYVKNWNPFLDSAILMRTLARVLLLRGR